jgi:hypothetical protein
MPTSIASIMEMDGLSLSLDTERGKAREKEDGGGMDKEKVKDKLPSDIKAEKTRRRSLTLDTRSTEKAMVSPKGKPLSTKAALSITRGNLG